jgi:predicted Holliday junction resolvase-like endonuclease
MIFKGIVSQIKNKLLLILFSAVALLVVLLLLAQNKIQNLNDEVDSRETAMNVQVKQWKDEFGRLHYENSVIHLKSDKVAKELLKQDSSLKQMNIKWNQVHSLNKSVTETHYHIEAPLTEHTKTDGTKVDSIHYKGTWLTIRGEVDSKKKVSKIDYTHRDTITTVIKAKRKKVFFKLLPIGPLEFKSESMAADTSSKIVHQTTILKEK